MTGSISIVRRNFLRVMMVTMRLRGGVMVTHVCMYAPARVMMVTMRLESVVVFDVRVRVSEHWVMYAVGVMVMVSEHWVRSPPLPSPQGSGFRTLGQG